LDILFAAFGTIDLKKHKFSKLTKFLENSSLEAFEKMNLFEKINTNSPNN
jgi:hypothetical protein